MTAIAGSCSAKASVRLFTRNAMTGRSDFRALSRRRCAPEAGLYFRVIRKVRSSDVTPCRHRQSRHLPSGTAGVGAEAIGVPGAPGLGGPPATIPAGFFSTNLRFHGPEINIRAITAIKQRRRSSASSSCSSASSAQAGCWISLARSDAALIYVKYSSNQRINFKDPAEYERRIALRSE